MQVVDGMRPDLLFLENVWLGYPRYIRQNRAYWNAQGLIIPPGNNMAVEAAKWGMNGSPRFSLASLVDVNIDARPVMFLRTLEHPEEPMLRARFEYRPLGPAFRWYRKPCKETFQRYLAAQKKTQVPDDEIQDSRFHVAGVSDWRNYWEWGSLAPWEKGILYEGYWDQQSRHLNRMLNHAAQFVQVGRQQDAMDVYKVAAEFGKKYLDTHPDAPLEGYRGVAVAFYQLSDPQSIKYFQLWTYFCRKVGLHNSKEAGNYKGTMDLLKANKAEKLDDPDDPRLGKRVCYDKVCCVW